MYYANEPRSEDQDGYFTHQVLFLFHVFPRKNMDINLKFFMKNTSLETPSPPYS